ncbi:hypothetical protein BB559_001839 [Furculomyces boomerangus]|uniref:BZIP domain-containing protein n=2 Tax=Harpellales TaxID=61421 RepID=A0A2T9Z0D5_9FUNG|nr:hypothetical protein BB559_001839 [Furculomyces boomerangus]PWA03758.1 hypothetical protein BB558_000052 [Smittium angustum]
MSDKSNTTSTWESIKALQDSLDNGFISTNDIQEELDFWSSVNVQTDIQTPPVFNEQQEIKISNPFVFNVKNAKLQVNQPSNKTTLSKEPVHQSNSLNIDIVMNRLLDLTRKSSPDSALNDTTNKHSSEASTADIIGLYLQEHVKHDLKENKEFDQDALIKHQASKYLQELSDSQKNQTNSEQSYNNISDSVTLNGTPSHINLQNIENQFKIADRISATTDLQTSIVSAIDREIAKPRSMVQIDSSKVPNKKKNVSAHKSQPLRLDSSANMTFDHASEMSNDSSKKRSPSEEDKRKRNTAASARFRVKKKLKEQQLEQKNQEMESKLAEMERRVQELEMENGWLKNIVIEKDSNLLETKGCPCHHPHGYSATECIRMSYSEYENPSSSHLHITPRLSHK